MEYYLDSADLSVISASLARWPLAGVTTNPTILARDIAPDADLRDLLLAIRRLTGDLRLFVQVTREDTEGMCADARCICRVLGGLLTVKIPATAEGFAAIRQLKAEGISTAATAVYTTSQAMLAAQSGADFAAPYVSHLDNLSEDGPAVAAEMQRQICLHGLPTKVLAASFRTAAQVERCIAGGVQSVTVTGEMLGILSAHPGTDRELSSFGQNWSARFPSGISELLG